MDFAVKTVVFVLLVVAVIGRIVPVENDSGNDTEDNNTIIESSEEDVKVCNESAVERNVEGDSPDEIVCPTPQCADESCRIETPPGHSCPTCICDGYREKNDFEPLAQPSEEPNFESRNETEDREISLASIVCNGSSDDQKECIPPKYELESGDIKLRQTHFLKVNPGIAIVDDDMEVSDQNSSSDEEPETTDSDGNDIRDIHAVASAMKGPRRKRSANSQTVITNSPADQQRWTVLQQDQVMQNVQQSGEIDELERESVDENNEGYDEIKVFKEGSEIEESTSNEITDLYDEESVIWEKTVPGCPTPLCENSSCRIGIPQGHRCPTCICTRSVSNRQP